MFPPYLKLIVGFRAKKQQQEQIVVSSELL